jgi:hypothetical protein
MKGKLYSHYVSLVDAISILTKILIQHHLRRGGGR